MKLKSFFLTLSVSVVFLVFLSLGSFWWILSQSPLNLLSGGVNSQPQATIFIPRQAPIMISLLVNPDQLETFRKLMVSPNARRNGTIEFRKLQKSLLGDTKINYPLDIQPWLGEEITLAVTSLDLDRDRNNGVQPGYLLVASTKDPELSKEFLQLTFSQQTGVGNNNLIFESYKGVNLIYQNPENITSKTKISAAALVGDFVLFANESQVLKDAINNAQAIELNLNNSPDYQQALKTIVEPRILVSYVNIPTLSAWLANVTTPEIKALKQLLTLTVSITPQGLAAETALIGVTGADNQPPALSEPIDALKYVPANSMITAASTNLNEFWIQISQGLEQNSPLQELLKQGIKAIETPLKIDLAQDIFSWVKGEYAIAILPNSDHKLDWVFVAQKSDDNQVQTAINHLDEVAQTQGLSLDKLPLSNNQITTWTRLNTNSNNNSVSLNTDVKGIHTSVENYEIFSTSIVALNQVLDQEKNLLNSPDFQAIIQALPTKNDGYLYIDWQATEPVIAAKFPFIKVIELAGKPLFDHLRSLTLTSQGSQENIRRATVFFYLE